MKMYRPVASFKKFRSTWAILFILFLTVLGLRNVEFQKLEAVQPVHFEVIKHQKFDFSDSRPRRSFNFSYSNKPVLHPKVFDPNQATENELLAVGLPKFLALRIIHYVEKGGKFRKTEDLRKIFGMEERYFVKMQPFVNIVPIVKESPNTFKKELSTEIKPPTFHKTEAKYFDINTVDTSTLILLKGVGSVTAKSLVRFRTALGGFVSLDQIKETRGISEEALAEILKYGSLKSPHKDIQINSISEAELEKHPYVSGFEAKILIAYRKEHGAYTNLESLKKVRPLKPEFFVRIAPYLNFN